MRINNNSTQNIDLMILESSGAVLLLYRELVMPRTLASPLLTLLLQSQLWSSYFKYIEKELDNV